MADGLGLPHAFPLVLPPGPVLADYLNLTVPVSSADEVRQLVLDAVRPALPTPMPGCDGVYEILQHGRQRGTLAFKRRGQVLVVSLSGLALQGLRSTGCYEALLWVFAEREHRVSHLDAALDVHGVDAPSLVRDAIRLGHARRVRFAHLRQDRWAPAESHLGLNVSGEETGTVYFGARNARVRLALYDKGHERRQRGYGDFGPWLRLEMRFRGGDERAVPLSLRDASDPAAVFWHHVPRSLARCLSAPAWSPVPDALGFDLPARQSVSPLDVARRFAERHRAQVLELSAALGPNGARTMAHLLGLARAGALPPVVRRPRVAPAGAA